MYISTDFKILAFDIRPRVKRQKFLYILVMEKKMSAPQTTEFNFKISEHNIVLQTKILTPELLAQEKLAAKTSKEVQHILHFKTFSVRTGEKTLSVDANVAREKIKQYLPDLDLSDLELKAMLEHIANGNQKRSYKKNHLEQFIQDFRRKAPEPKRSLEDLKVIDSSQKSKVSPSTIAIKKPQHEQSSIKTIKNLSSLASIWKSFKEEIKITAKQFEDLFAPINKFLSNIDAKVPSLKLDSTNHQIMLGNKSLLKLDPAIYDKKSGKYSLTKQWFAKFLMHILSRPELPESFRKEVEQEKTRIAQLLLNFPMGRTTKNGQYEMRELNEEEKMASRTIPRGSPIPIAESIEQMMPPKEKDFAEETRREKLRKHPEYSTSSFFNDQDLEEVEVPHRVEERRKAISPTGLTKEPLFEASSAPIRVPSLSEMSQNPAQKMDWISDIDFFDAMAARVLSDKQ